MSVQPLSQFDTAKQPAIKSPVISVAAGDGIGPEIMSAVLRILDAAGAGLTYDFIETGERLYLQGITSGIRKESWETLMKNRIFLKAPITTPRGDGYKILNVTIRKTLGLFANVRPTVSYYPIVPSGAEKMDVVIVRENEEDLYAGVEHRQTTDVVQCLKLISRQGSEKIIRYAFEYARVNGRKKVTCMVKDNIMKMTDGLFQRVFTEVAKEYPEIQTESMIIDIGAAMLATQPQRFDVVVAPNLYGDILSDIAAQVAGSVGLAGSANIGDKIAMFEAVHGSAPDIAGKDMANPSGLLNAAVMMLNHMGITEPASRIANAWMKTLEDGIHTADIYQEGKSKVRASTSAFTQAIIDRLDEQPFHIQPVTPGSSSGEGISVIIGERPSVRKSLVGVDIFLDWSGGTADQLGRAIASLAGDNLMLKMITNRGVKVYPDGNPETFCTDHWRCRFVSVKNQRNEGTPTFSTIGKSDIPWLIYRLSAEGYDVVKTENLYLFDDERGFSLGQGE